MFNDNIKFVAQSIEKTPVIEKNGCYYQNFQNFFPDYILKKLVSVDRDNSAFTTLQTQERSPRVRMEYTEHIIKEISLIFRSKSVVDVLEKKYNTLLKFDSVDIWFDYKGYRLSPHKDDTRIALALQIYLDTDESIPGTAIFDSTNVCLRRILDTEEYYKPFQVFKYGQNNGYCLRNNEYSWHGTEFTMDNEKTRKSVYVRYERN